MVVACLLAFTYACLFYEVKCSLGIEVCTVFRSQQPSFYLSVLVLQQFSPGNPGDVALCMYWTRNSHSAAPRTLCHWT